MVESVSATSALVIFEAYTVFVMLHPLVSVSTSCCYLVHPLHGQNNEWQYDAIQGTVSQKRFVSTALTQIANGGSVACMLHMYVMVMLVLV